MAGSLTVDTLQADSTSTLVIKNGVANTPPTIQDSAGTQIGTFCRAWLNYSGSAITASFNVSSVTKNGTGDYTITFTNAMPDINYSMVTSCDQGTVGGTSATFVLGGASGIARTTTTIRVYLRFSTAYNDVNSNYAFFR